MKSIWTDGPVRMHKPLKSRMVALWALWIVAAALLCLWLAGLATGNVLGGWIHVLIAGAIVLGTLNIVYTFKYGEFLEPFFYRWFGDSNLRHSKPAPSKNGDGPGNLPG
jgi:hypothetical protein